MGGMLNGIQGLYSALIAGDADGVMALFAAEPRLDTPLQGEVRGEEAVKEFVAKQQAWLEEHAAEAQVLADTSDAERVVVEFVLFLRHQGEDIDIPVAVVADLSGDGAAWLRIYHSTWPLSGEHALRPPLLELDSDEKKMVARLLKEVGLT